MAKMFIFLKQKKQRQTYKYHLFCTEIVKMLVLSLLIDLQNWLQLEPTKQKPICFNHSFFFAFTFFFIL